MFSKTIFFSLLRLQASNKTLLKTYYSLYYKLSGDKELHQKEQLSSRIALRERFNLDLMQCTDEYSSETSFTQKTMSCALPELAELETGIKEILFADTWDRCLELEAANLEKYHGTLQQDMLPASAKAILAKNLY